MNPGSKFKIGLVVIVLNLSFISCCPFIKAKDLGHHFVLSEYDDVDRRILYSINKCSGSGIEIVPMTVIKYSNDSRWIIAKTSKPGLSTNYEYWIIDKDFAIPKDDDKIAKAIKSHLFGPLDSLGFKKKIDSLKINLRLKKI